MELKVLQEVDSIIPYTKTSLKDFLTPLTKDLNKGATIRDTIVDEASLMTFQGMELEQMLELLILVATQNIQNNLDYDKLATRILLLSIYRTSLKDYSKAKDFDSHYQKSFLNYINDSVEDNLLHHDMTKVYSENDLKKISKMLRPEMDETFNFVGLDTALKRYMKYNWDQHVIETPQFMWMRIAMWMAIKEEKKLEWIEQFYNKLADLEYIPGGSTNIGAGSTYPKLSNCYLIDTEDDTISIFENIKNIALISKATGGLGISITKLRASGSPVKSNNSFSTGPIPFIKVMDTTLKSMARAGKKHGAMCIYMENWHYDFPDFLDLRQNAGDDYRRVRTANTAVYISDEFMERVQNDQEWYLFDPAETPDLTELYGDAFSERYRYYCEEADNGRISLYKVVKAKDQFRQILTSLVATSHPWLTWKDTINLRALNNNTGTIHTSNLCTEICLPQDKDNIAVCNLAYINLARHVIPHKVKNKSKVDWDKLEESVKVATRHLDNIVDVNDLSVLEAKNSDESNRAIGLGMSGMAEIFELFGYAYDSDEAYELADKVTEFISYHAIDTSADLAQEKGVYKHFKGSLWSKGLVPYDTIGAVDESRKNSVFKQNTDLNMDWDKLREKVKDGVRNATLMAIAPNASTGIVLGTSPGIDVRFSQIFSRATSRGKYLDINKNLVHDLEELGIWQDVKDQVIEKYGDLSEIEEIPDELKAVYKTSFQVAPVGVIEVASRAQKWIDQAISRNMYLETRNVDEIMDIYAEAWRRGLKTTYYLHTKPRHSAEQSSVKVNKSKSMQQKGFAGVIANKQEVDIDAATVDAVSASPKTETEGELNRMVEQKTPVIQSDMGCPTDPAERAACDACQ